MKNIFICIDGWRVCRCLENDEQLTTVFMKTPLWPLPPFFLSVSPPVAPTPWHRQNSSCYGIFCLSNRLGTKKSKVSTFPNDILRSAFIFYVSHLEIWKLWAIFTRRWLKNYPSHIDFWSGKRYTLLLLRVTDLKPFRICMDYLPFGNKFISDSVGIMATWPDMDIGANTWRSSMGQSMTWDSGLLPEEI